MADEVKCDQCGATMFPTGETTAAAVARTSSTSGVQNDAARKHADDIRRKVDEKGLIYKCPVCGYSKRFKPAPEPAAAGATL